MTAWILKTHNRISRKIRRLPHWARDLLDLVSYVNFFGLIPTLALLMLSPKHFFRRLPLILQQRKNLYRTPVKFFTNAGSLFVLLFFLRHQELQLLIDSSQALLTMLVLIPVTPIFMACLAVVLWSIYQLPRLIPVNPSFPAPSPYPLRLATSPKVFGQLDKPRFFWGLFYISIYFIAAWQLAQFVTAQASSLLYELLTLIETQKGLVEIIIAILVLVCTALIVHWLVYRPYAEMIRGCSKQPTDLTNSSKVEYDRIMSRFGQLVND